jgi:hypothetical protein
MGETERSMGNRIRDGKRETGNEKYNVNKYRTIHGEIHERSKKNTKRFIGDTGRCMEGTERSGMVDLRRWREFRDRRSRRDTGGLMENT